MNYYWEIYLRIHPGRQLIVCSTLYVYAYPEMHYKGTVFKYYVYQCLSKLMGEQHYKTVSEKINSGKHAPPPPQIIVAHLANPAYAHELLLINLFENPPWQTVDSV